jgi:hypothetical protein
MCTWSSSILAGKSFSSAQNYSSAFHAAFDPTDAVAGGNSTSSLRQIVAEGGIEVVRATPVSRSASITRVAAGTRSR